MSEQAKSAAKFAREKLGAKVDELAPEAGLRALHDGEEGGGSAPWIQLPGGDRLLSAWARECGQILTDKPVFRRHNVPVTINGETHELDVVTPAQFRTLLEEFAVPYKSYWVSAGRGNTQKVEQKSPASMMPDCARATLESRQFLDALRRIERVNLVRMPVLRSDGRIELLPEGYDEESEILTVNSGITINEGLTPVEGATILRDYLAEFPVIDDRSLAVAVAEMVALYVHGLQELTANRMGFLYKSNKVRSGKSLLAQFGISGPYGLAEGQTLGTQEELKKLLDATALLGSPYLFFDNLTGHVKSNLLEGFMTTPVWTGRVMGTQKTFKAPKGTIVIITGNNLTTSPDIAERVLVCSLHTEEADPQSRKLKRIFTSQYLARATTRSDLLSALWAMVRGWVAIRGTQERSWRRIAGFEEWSDLIGGIVTAAGFADPLAKPKEEEMTNREELDAHELVEQLVKDMRLTPGRSMHEFTFQELVDCCVENDCYSWKIEGKQRRDDGGDEWFECNSKSQAALGRVFGTDMSGQIYALKDGTRVRFGKRGHNRHRRYQVEILPDKP